MKAKLTRITASGAMRTQEMVGWCRNVPTIGEPFLIMNDDPIEKDSGIPDLPNNNRAVTTSRVMRTNKKFDGGVEFWTESGTNYLFEELTEA